ncbi:hypothetical protein PR048_017345 [Dryococelus australis]|uniref:Uncharacterized protein n=1 Tax=Dryococelus australis TaxID=614101 RepID=A0ABQ9H993_9NEOP|nr:hypothetical protein PR048_017345 [Dryococelus australis]
MQPLSVVENTGFKRLINHLEPRYNFPSRKVLSNKYQNEMYAELSKCVSDGLPTVQYVAITTNFCTSCTINDYMLLTVHFFRNSHDTFQQCQKVIEVIAFQEVGRTADNIRHFISDLLLQWGLTTEVVAVVWDGGTDITNALNE